MDWEARLERLRMSSAAVIERPSLRSIVQETPVSNSKFLESFSSYEKQRAPHLSEVLEKLQRDARESYSSRGAIRPTSTTSNSITTSSVGTDYYDSARALLKFRQDLRERTDHITKGEWGCARADGKREWVTYIYKVGQMLWPYI